MKAHMQAYTLTLFIPLGIVASGCSVLWLAAYCAWLYGSFYLSVRSEL